MGGVGPSPSAEPSAFLEHFAWDRLTLTWSAPVPIVTGGLLALQPEGMSLRSDSGVCCASAEGLPMLPHLPTLVLSSVHVF